MPWPKSGLIPLRPLMPVNWLPSIAGNTGGNRSAGIVPLVRLLASRLVTPLPSRTTLPWSPAVKLATTAPAASLSLVIMPSLNCDAAMVPIIWLASTGPLKLAARMA